MSARTSPRRAEIPANVDAYIAGFSAEQRVLLESVRQAILVAVPSPTEKIRYGMPAVMLGGRYAVHFAGWKKHIGIYPVPTLPPGLEERVAPYRTSKDSVNLSYSKPLPLDLVTELTAAIVALRS